MFALLTSELESELENSTFEFKSDYTFEVIQANESTETGSWSLKSDGSELTLDKGTASERTLTVKSLTVSSLILNLEESESFEELERFGITDEIKIIVDLYLAK